MASSIPSFLARGGLQGPAAFPHVPQPVEGPDWGAAIGALQGELQTKKRADEAAWLAKTAAEAETEWLDKQAELSKTVAADGKGFAQAVKQGYAQHMAAKLQGAPSPEAQRDLYVRLTNYGRTAIGGAIKDEAKLGIAAQQQAIDQGLAARAGAVWRTGDMDAALDAADQDISRAADAKLIPAPEVEAWRQKARAGLADARLRHLADKDPDAAIAEMKSGRFDGMLTPAQLDARQNAAEGELRRRQAEARAAQAEVKLEAHAAWGAIDRTVVQGYAPAPGAVDEARALALRAGDKKLARRIDDTLKSYGDLAAFAAQPPQEQAAAVQAEDAALRRDGADDAKLARLQARARISDARNKAFEQDRTGFAQVEGALPGPALGAREFISVEALQQRSLKADAAGERYGLRPGQMPRFAVAEAAAYAQWWGEQAPGDQAQALGVLKQAWGADGLKATMAVVAKDKAQAQLAAVGALAADAPELAGDVLRGHRLRKESPDLLPKPLDYRGDVEARLRDAFGMQPEVRHLVVEQALDLYAMRQARDGKFNKDYDAGAMRRALDDVAGPIVRLNGVSVPLPERGLDGDRFEAWLRALRPDDMPDARAGAARLDGPVLADAKLQAVGQGRYLVKLVDSYAMDERQGKPFVLDYGAIETARARANVKGRGGSEAVREGRK